MNNFVRDFFSVLAVVIVVCTCLIIIGGGPLTKKKIEDVLFFIVVITPGITLGIIERYFFEPTWSILVVYHLLLFLLTRKITLEGLDTFLALIIPTIAVGYFFCDTLSRYGLSHFATVYFVTSTFGTVCLVELINKFFGTPVDQDQWTSPTATIVSFLVLISAVISSHLNPLIM